MTNNNHALQSNVLKLSFHVVLAGGTQACIEIQPGDALLDAQGYIRFFSLRFNDGVVGRFQLLPNRSQQNSALDAVKNFLLPFGLSLISGEVVDDIEGTIVDDLIGFFLEEAASEAIINSFFWEEPLANTSYYEITSGELVIEKPIQVIF